jgi:hypothetical protein
LESVSIDTIWDAGRAALLCDVCTFIKLQGSLKLQILQDKHLLTIYKAKGDNGISFT